jgi:von Willebrand factor type A domain
MSINFRAKAGTLAAIAATAILTSACSREQAPEQAATPRPASANGPTLQPQVPPSPPPPATLTDVNLAAADMGGAVEEISANYGPGYYGHRLIDDLSEPTWKVPNTWSFSAVNWAKYPVDFVFSFFERNPALIGAVTLLLGDDVIGAPRTVEVWTSMDLSPEKFVKVAGTEIPAQPGEHTVSFPAVTARFVKLRVLSGGHNEVAGEDNRRRQVAQGLLEIAEVRILEAARADYVALFTRIPDAHRWKGSPREAAQRGLDWLQQAAVHWPGGTKCFGCHVQAQALMGQAVALKENYRVNMRSVNELGEIARGAMRDADSLPYSMFAAMGVAYADAALGQDGDSWTLKDADYLMTELLEDGGMYEPVYRQEVPIIQGRIMYTANTIVALKHAGAQSNDPKYEAAVSRALAFIAAQPPQTTQDKVFKIIALMRYGTPDQKRTAWSVAEDLAADQQPDGGWKEVPALGGSNAFATGQALYAFKQAGVSVQSEMFRKGAEYLLKKQILDATDAHGSWRSEHSQSHRPSNFAPTMWAVIGLAGSYGTEPLGGLQILRQGDKLAARNLEIVLDVSGSMNTKLGASTRWQTALDVLKDVVATLPEDLNVGLRVYGHRYASKSAQTCQDTELVVPIAKLDRPRIVQAATALRPRGETPLVRSVQKAVGDLKSAGGGAVILITDGEESCGGNAQAAAREIQASGVNVTLNIVGFALQGKSAEAELGSFAGSTGGQYYGAQDGAQLAHAVRLAALQHLPYDVLDANGQVVVSGETSELSQELPPGNYRVRVQALEQAFEEPVTIVPNQITALRLEVEGDHFVVRH